jgi:KRAB domain-containing zinc finger protein
MTHIKIHISDKNQKCEVCYKVFFEGSNLMAHMRIHIGEKKHKFEVCNKDFLQEVILSHI